MLDEKQPEHVEKLFYMLKDVYENATYWMFATNTDEGSEMLREALQHRMLAMTPGSSTLAQTLIGHNGRIHSLVLVFIKRTAITWDEVQEVCKQCGLTDDVDPDDFFCACLCPEEDRDSIFRALAMAAVGKGINVPRAAEGN